MQARELFLRMKERLNWMLQLWMVGTRPQVPPEWPALAVGLYIAHLGVVTTLFVTFPYSKFAHMLYRTLAMIHERAASRPAGA